MSAVMTKTTKAKAAAASPLEELVTRALAHRRELHAKPKFGDARDEKLTAKAYLAEALANRRTTVESLEKLDAYLAKVQPEDAPLVHAFIAGVHRKVVATQFADGAALRPPLRNLHTCCGDVGVAPADYPMWTYQFMENGTNPLELVAYTVWKAALSHPECFGAIEDWDAHERKSRECHESYEAACLAIAQAAELGRDVVAHHEGADLWRLTFKWRGADTGVPYGVDAAAGARLVEWVAAQA